MGAEGLEPLSSRTPERWSWPETSAVSTPARSFSCAFLAVFWVRGRFHPYLLHKGRSLSKEVHRREPFGRVGAALTSRRPKPRTDRSSSAPSRVAGRRGGSGPLSAPLTRARNRSPVSDFSHPRTQKPTFFFQPVSASLLLLRTPLAIWPGSTFLL